MSNLSPTKFKVSYLRRKPELSWSLVFPNVEDMHTDTEMLLAEPTPQTVEF